MWVDPVEAVRATLEDRLSVREVMERIVDVSMDDATQDGV